jgi:PAS domain S-box-containing protein
MLDKEKIDLTSAQLSMALEKIPVGITIIDQDGHILYYNEYCSRFVDRKPEYIGNHIGFCHKKPESIEKIEKILVELRDGKREDFYYESERNGKKLGITVSPFEFDGKFIGFIQSFVVIR